MSQHKIDTSAVEKEYGMGGGSSGGSDWFKILEGDNRIRIVSPLTIYVSHFSKGGYSGVCIGKAHKCPGCLRDDEIAEQKKNESDPEKAKKIRLTRNIKWLGWVLDYGAIERMKKDPDINEEMFKLAKLPHTVTKAVEKLQNDPDWSFAEFPMPYGVNLNAVGAGTNAVQYNLFPSPHTTLPAELMEKIAKLSDPETIVEKIKDKKKKELGVEGSVATTEAHDRSVDYPEEDIDVDSIPF